MISSLELARLSGCSQGTVDRALHNRPGISEATKNHILALAAKHGYRPHPAARELLTGERRTIGAIIPAINSVFFMDLMNTIRQALGGYRFILTQVSNAAEFLDTLQEFASLRTRLAVAVPPEADIELPDSLLQSLPVACVVNPCRGKRVCNLIPDEVEAGRTATRHLIQHGHERIVHLCPQRESPAIVNRARGYEAEMKRQGFRSLVLRQWSADDLLPQLKPFGATAVFCHNDWLALSVIRALNQSGVRVPDDLSVLGVDDSPTFNSLCPDISTLHYPAESIAKAVAALVNEKIPPKIAAMSVVERATVRTL